MKNIEKAHAASILLDHADVVANFDNWVCAAPSCSKDYGKMHPTGLDIRSHQVDALEEADFTFNDKTLYDREYSARETVETSDMVRWFDGECHNFIKSRPGPKDRTIVILGWEAVTGDGGHLFMTDLQFYKDEVPDLMDRLAEFVGKPKYTELEAQLKEKK